MYSTVYLFISEIIRSYIILLLEDKNHVRKFYNYVR